MLNVSPRTKPQSVTPASSRQFDGQARRRRHGRDQRDAGEQRLLHQLERGAARDRPASSDRAAGVFEQPPADDLVHGVVTADVLGHRLAARRRDETARRRAGRRWSRRRPARAAASCGSARTTTAGTRPITRRPPAPASGATRSCGARTARTTRSSSPGAVRRAASSSRVTASPTTVHLSVLSRASTSASSQYSMSAELVGAADDVLGEEKPRGELAIGARRAHDHGERARR